MTTETIDIRIREDGSRVVKRNIDEVGGSAERAAGGVDTLKKALGALAAVLAVDRLRKYADTWTDLNSRIRIVTGSHEAATAVMGRLETMARRTYSSLELTTESYLANAVALGELGLSTEKQLQFAESLNNALVVSGAKAEVAASIQNSLSKAMALGTLSGVNLNNVIQSGGRVAELLAKELNTSVNSLRTFGEQGKITGAVIQSALIGNLEILRAEADSMPATVGDALMLIDNAFLGFIGRLDTAIGASAFMAEALIWVADNMDLVGAALLALGAAVVVAFAPGAIIAFTGALKALWIVVLANPFVALAAAIAGAVTFLAIYGDEINSGIDATTTMKDVILALAEVAVAAWGMLAELAEAVWGGLGDLATTAYQDVTNSTDDATKQWANQYSTFYDDVGSGFAGVVKGIARTLDAIGGLLTGMGISIARVFSGMPALFSSIFAEVYNAVALKIQDIINTTIRGVNTLRELVGKDPIELIKLETKKVNKQALEEYGANIAAGIDAGFESQGGFMEKQVDALFSRAADIGKQRLADAAAAGTADLNKALAAAATGGADAKEVEKAAKAMERLKNELRSLLNTIAPVEGALLEMHKAEETLSRSVEKGLISKAEEARYLTLLQAHYQDIIDPLGKVNRELDQQSRLLGMTTQARQVEAQMLTITQDLMKQGIQLSQQETSALRNKLVALQDLNALVSAQDTLLAGSVQKRKDFQVQLEAITALLADPTGGFTGADATTSLMQQMPDLFEGTQEAMDAQMAQYQTMYEQIDLMRQADVISEQTAAQMKSKVNAMQQETQLKQSSQFFGLLAGLSKSGNSKLAAIGKAAAATQATIDGVVAVQKALASSPPPMNYAMAAATGVMAAANVAQILGTNLGFMTGGSFNVGGSGGADSQLVAFRASPGEQVAVSTPSQVRKGDPNEGSSGTPPEQNIRIVNVVDPEMVGDFLSSSAGERTLVNVIQRNAGAIKSMLQS